MGGHNRIIYLRGERFGRLVIVGEGKKQLKAGPSFAYLCRCDCGTELLILPGNLKAGNQRSCGCWARDPNRKRNWVHGHKTGGKATKVYKAWESMNRRCSSPSDPGYKNYGGRGITVCARWSESFENFLSDMGQPPTTSRYWSIGRIDNWAPYCPKNCRWEYPKQQSRNRRPHSHRFASAFGETKTVAEWLDDPRCIVTKAALHQRLDAGMTAESAITTPIISQKESSDHARHVRWNGHRSK